MREFRSGVEEINESKEVPGLTVDIKKMASARALELSVWEARWEARSMQEVY